MRGLILALLLSGCGQPQSDCWFLHFPEVWVNTMGLTSCENLANFMFNYRCLRGLPRSVERKVMKGLDLHVREYIAPKKPLAPGEYIGGVYHSRSRNIVVLPDAFSLPHELFHAELHILNGDMDREHTHPFWEVIKRHRGEILHEYGECNE